MTRNRFLTGSLASIAVASAITLAAPAAQAVDRGCGLPGLDAVYTSVVHSPVFRTVPEQTHQEWAWERDVDQYSYEFSREVSPAGIANHWTREVPGPVEYLFSLTVVDSPAVPGTRGTPEVGHYETVVVTPAVVTTEWEYQHHVTGNLRWEDVDWGAQNGKGSGWEQTGNTRETELEPAVTTQIWVVDAAAVLGTPATPAITHVDSAWATSSPGADWTGPSDARPGPSSTETQSTGGDAPAGAGWQLVSSIEIPAVIDSVWADVAPDGYQPTGASKVVGSSHEQNDGTSTVAPDGSGWTQVADSAVTVVDAPTSDELVTDGFVEQVVVSAAQPATEPCVDAPATDNPPPTGSQAAPASGATSAPVASVLPNTGNDIPPWMAPAGLAAMLAGVAMIRFGRRYPAS